MGEFPGRLRPVLDDSRLPVLRQVPVRGLVLAALLVDYHRVLHALILRALRLDVDVLLVRVAVLEVPSRTVDDAWLGDSRVAPEQRLLVFH